MTADYFDGTITALIERVPFHIFTVELNTDFSTKGLSAQEIQSIVAAWQAGAISRETMTDLFRRGEVLPEGRSAGEETQAIRNEKPAPAGTEMSQV